MGLFNGKPKFKGTPIIAFASEEDRLDAAVDTFLWIKDYLETVSSNSEGKTIRDIASHFDSVPKDMKKIGMSEYQWMDFNRMMFWFVYDVSITRKEDYFKEVNQRVIMRMLEEKRYSSEEVLCDRLKKSELDKSFVREVIEAYEFQKSLCFNYWKYYS